MKVCELMSLPVITVRAQDRVAEAFAVVMNEGIRHLPITDNSDQLVGILSDRDLRNVVVIDDQRPEKNREYWVPDSIKVEKIMVRDPEVADPEQDVREAMEVMDRRNISCLPVVADGHVVGILTTKDLMRAFSNRTPDARF